MAFPPQSRETGPALPSIIVPRPADRTRSHHDMPFGRSPAMHIPGIDTTPDVPPPLPPPRMPFGDIMSPTNYESPMRRHDFGSSHHSSFASTYGSNTSSFNDLSGRFRRKEPRSIKDEGYSSWSSTERSQDSLPRFGMHHDTFQFRSPADEHGNSLKKALESSRPSEVSKPISLLTASANELLPKIRSGSPASSMPPQLPHHSRMFDSPRSADSGPMSAISPRSAPFQHHGGMDYRATADPFDPDRSPRTRTRNNSDDASSTQGSSHDYGYADEMDMDEAADLKRLQLSDRYATVGQKRRAASPPPNDSVPLGLQGPTDLVIRRNELGSRGSPTPRLTNSIQSPMHPLSRSNSYMSMSSGAPSVTTAPFERRSPGGSPGGVSPTSATSPYTTPLSLHPSPHPSFGARTPVHTRNVSATSPKKLHELQKPGGRFLMCECCPKKPKKFETREELRAHEAEKQYTCQYCSNRFKNKNEAERHMNSLHLRRHSWSCSALASYDRAFHESTSYPGQADTCGYCGEEFHRSGPPTSKGAKEATPEDWDARVLHLQEVHKFGECNSAKKFFRADHFRQHLKHSHAGSSGKWTNMLETACMIEEEPRLRDDVSY